MSTIKGKIIKGIGGFYYVETGDDPLKSKIYECKAKGIFRNMKIKPLVGDDVNIEVIDEEKLLGNIASILPRSSELIRPAVANCDQAVIIFAAADPTPNLNLLDRFLILMENQGMETKIIINKSDLVEEERAEKFKAVYELAGYETHVVSTKTEKGIEEVKGVFTGKMSVLAGPSGVGKSSILNILSPDIDVKTGEISEKIRRGKHTTRHSEIMYVSKDTFVMDTPGFSSLDIENITENDIQYHFREFNPFIEKCRYTGCVHINEPECAVKQAVREGKIKKVRYGNYKQIYEEIKNRRKW